MATLRCAILFFLTAIGWKQKDVLLSLFLHCFKNIFLQKCCFPKLFLFQYRKSLRWPGKQWLFCYMYCFYSALFTVCCKSEPKTTWIGPGYETRCGLSAKNERYGCAHGNCKTDCYTGHFLGSRWAHYAGKYIVCKRGPVRAIRSVGADQGRADVRSIQIVPDKIGRAASRSVATWNEKNRCDRQENWPISPMEKGRHQDPDNTTSG